MIESSLTHQGKRSESYLQSVLNLARPNVGLRLAECLVTVGVEVPTNRVDGVTEALAPSITDIARIAGNPGVSNIAINTGDVGRVPAELYLVE